VNRILIPFCFSLSCLIGYYAWRISRTGYHHPKWDIQESISAKDNKIVAKVGEANISQQEIDFELWLLSTNLNSQDQDSNNTDEGEKVAFDKTNPPPNSLYEEVVGSLMERRLLSQFIQHDQRFNSDQVARRETCTAEFDKTIAENSGVFNDPERQFYLKNMLCELSILHQYIDELVFASLEVQNSEMKDFFDANKQQYYRPSLATVRQILLPDEQQAHQIRRKINKNNFAELAKAHSMSPEAESGGQLGPFAAQSGMPHFFETAFTLRPGQISDILKSTYGFHIIMLESLIPKKTLSFEEVKPKIRKRLVALKKEKAYQEWVDLALHSVSITMPRHF
jgi:parvulin-like peptidyl-prolyl isomerase